MNTKPIHKYIESVSRRYAAGISREHSYRSDLEILIRQLIDGINVTNEPANVTDCGNPDYVITKGKIPVGYIEAKDVGKDLNSKSYKEQFSRYKSALDNLIITDYCWFQFFDHGELVHEVRIAEIKDDKVIPLPDQYESFLVRLTDFCEFIGQTIKSPKKLAKMMASKAQLLQDILQRAATSDEDSSANTTLRDQYKAFKDILIHDLTPKRFADVYAQTLAYGMFSARYQDTTIEDFSRQEAAELIPKSNPFLRKLFGYIAGPDIDERIVPTVNNLADIFRATDVTEILKDYGASTAQNDPIVHFYETFLAEYDPKLRKSRGVWYTPDPVVKFIVRAVDDILKTEFGLKDGLADNSKIKIKKKVVTKKTADRRSNLKEVEIEQEVHKVQVLDPATGTGTFLAETIRHIYKTKFQKMQGAWEGYVDKDLIPRLNGFELLMASYAMAHLKLDLILKETGYTKETKERFKVYLTNSLEEYHPDTGTLFANWLSSEANEANHIKRDSPVMVIMGNPPYSVSSGNRGEWIKTLISSYKQNLNERKINLDDDYIKFVRYAQYFVDKNKSGILAYISNNSFIDGITHRQMRKCLLDSFNQIYILDLHGSSMKNERKEDGQFDENVFDIRQGVSINIFIKTKKGSPKNIFHYDIFGNRENKYRFLNSNNLSQIPWSNLPIVSPYYFFVNKDFRNTNQYENGFKLSELFVSFSVGIETQRDTVCIEFQESIIKEKINFFKKLDSIELRKKYNLKKDGRDWKIELAKKDIELGGDFTKVMYRPFDERFTFYTGNSKGFMAYPRGKVMNNLFEKNNVSLIVCKQQSSFDFQHVFVTTKISEGNSISIQTKERSSVFPLYQFDKKNSTLLSNQCNRKPNFNPDKVSKIAESLNLTFTYEKEEDSISFAPIDILDYIYAVLHSPSYREKYKEFLKIDFPRIPYPKDSDMFRSLAALGGQIREMHLLESADIDEFITSYPQSGDNTVTRKMTKTSIGYEPTSDTHGLVWINDDQYFDSVPLIAWEFYIGGYQPAQKWLKDRKGRTLSYDDILHYQRIIVALSETDRLMKEIDEVWEV